MVKNGPYPFFTCDEKPYTIDTYAFDGESILVSGNGSKVGHVNYCNGKFNAYQRTYVLMDFKTDVFFVLHYLKAYLREYIIRKSNKASVPYIKLPHLVNFKIPLPPLAVQKEIVEILDTFTGMIDNLQKELEQRQKQFEYYRKSLLCKKDGTVQKVKEFAELKAGKAIKASELSETQDKSHLFPCFGGNGIRGYIEKKSHFGDYAIIGRQGALCGCVNWAQNYFYATEHAVVVTPKGQNNSRFLYYLFCEADLNQYKSQGAQPGLAVTNLNELQYYIPSLDKQQEIVDKLDTFEALISNIKQEIELRQKQYEYYREKLLTFE